MLNCIHGSGTLPSIGGITIDSQLLAILWGCLVLVTIFVFFRNICK